MSIIGPISPPQAAVETARQQLTEAETGEPKGDRRVRGRDQSRQSRTGPMEERFQRGRRIVRRRLRLRRPISRRRAQSISEAGRRLRSIQLRFSLMRISLHEEDATAHTKLDEAEADLTKARWRLESCMVRAPQRRDDLEEERGRGSPGRRRGPSSCAAYQNLATGGRE